MTLAACIAAHEASQPQPISTQADALTPRGHALVALYRFTELIRALDRSDREYVLSALRDEFPTDSIA